MSSGHVAIIGMAGRFPAARSVRDLWRLLSEGREATAWLSDDELIARGERPQALADPAYVRASMPLPDMEMFDAGFFGFTPREAAILDPQHRHFLEAAWEALEDAGHAPSRFPGAVGVFGGCGMQAYMARNLMTNRELMEQAGMFLLRHTGNDKDFLTTRVSYLLNLQGPSVGVQTACSTSLVATHMACQSLISGECDLALAGGASIEVPHGRGYRHAEGEILSSDGHCRAFSDDADGTLFGSGAAVVVLRRLEDALADGDQIYAVIRGSAVNNDGAGKAGYFAPSVEGQARAAAEALAIAGVEPRSVDYVEAHGTGTLLGDPIELAALAQAYGGAGPGRIGLGSIKTNIGHLDTAAGAASLIKAALALRHERIPASLNFARPNSRHDAAASPFRVVAEARAWTRGTRPRRAAVNSLGVGGTNAHVVLEEAPRTEAPQSQARPQLVVLSAKTPEALQGLGEKWRDFLANPPANFSADAAAFTTQEGREAFAFRMTLTGATAHDLAEALDARDGSLRAQARAADGPPRVVFMFPGGGAQFPGAGRGLYETRPAFRQAVDACFAALPGSAPADLRALMFERDDAQAARELEHPQRSVLAVFILGYAYAALWRDWGVRPAAVMGHSAGEYAAAVLAGVMSLRDALAALSLRGEIFAEQAGGAMLSVRAGAQEVKALAGGALDVAAVNGPELTVMAGPVGEIETFAARLNRKGVASSRLHIAVAAHSRLLDPALPRFRAHMAGVELKDPAIPLVSNLSGEWVKPGEMSQPDYWVRHLRETVRFNDGVRAVLDTPGTVLLEVGPGQDLGVLARLADAANEPLDVMASSPTAGARLDDEAVALTAAGRLWANGTEVDFAALRAGAVRRRISLPTYAFEKQRCWIEPGQDLGEMAAPATRSASVEHWLYEPCWTPQPAPATADERDGAWLVFADGSPLSRAVLDLLTARRARVSVVEAADAFAQVAKGRFRVSPRAEDYRNLLTALEAEGPPPARILHLWSLAAPAPDLGTSGGQPLGFDSLFLLGQAMQLLGWEGARRLCVATAGAFSTTGEAASRPDLASLAGPCRVLPRETPGLTARLVDLGETYEAAAAAEALTAEAQAGEGGATVALRNGERLVLGERPLGTAAKRAPRLRRDAVYMITGGLGDLGLELAGWLHDAHDARLVLTTRGPLRAPEADARRRRLKALEAAGAQVLVVEADVADPVQARRAIEAARARFGRLDGLFHAAGVLDDGLAATKTLEGAHAVLRPKAGGALVLNALLPAGSLDLFAVFSSTSAVVGPPGQIDYAAANAVLDAIAAGRPDGLSIAWGAWSDVGMAARLARGEPLSRLAGAHPLLGPAREAAGGFTFETTYRPESLWVLQEHKIGGRPVLPGSAYLEIAAAAADAAGLGPAVTLRGVNFIAPMVFPDEAARRVRTTLAAEAGGARRVVVESRPEATQAWTLHFEARLSRTFGTDRARRPKPGVRHQPLAKERLDLDDRGVAFGRRWRCLRSAACSDLEAVASVGLERALRSDLAAYVAHPALMDVSATIGLFLMPEAERSDGVFAPLSIDEVALHGRLPARFDVKARLAGSRVQGQARFDVELTDGRGRLLADLKGFTLRKVDRASLAQAPASDSDAPPLTRLLATGIRAEEAPMAFTAALSHGGRQVIVTPAPLARLRAASAARPVAAAPRRPVTTEHVFADQIEAQVARMCAEVLGAADMGPQDDFLSFGGGSLAAIRLFARIRKELGAELALSALFQAPTIRELAALVRAARGDAASTPEPTPAFGWSPLVRIAAGPADRRPVFCVHGAGGNVVGFKPLADRLVEDRAFYGLQAQGVDGKLPPHETIEDMAACYIRAIRTVAPRGPYLLAGYSAGGVIAYEMAQQLLRAGDRVDGLVMIDSLEPSEVLRPISWPDRLKQLHRLDRRVILDWPRNLLRDRGHARFVRSLRTGEMVAPLTALEHAGAVVSDAYYRAQAAYRTRPYGGDMLLIRAARARMHFLRSGPKLGWDKVAHGRIKVLDVDADHLSVFSEPAISRLAAELRAEFARLDARAQAELHALGVAAE